MQWSFHLLGKSVISKVDSDVVPASQAYPAGNPTGRRNLSMASLMGWASGKVQALARTQEMVSNIDGLSY
jgi:hypothetical protein